MSLYQQVFQQLNHKRSVSSFILSFCPYCLSPLFLVSSSFFPSFPSLYSFVLSLSFLLSFIAFICPFFPVTFFILLSFFPSFLHSFLSSYFVTFLCCFFHCCSQRPPSYVFFLHFFKFCLHFQMLLLFFLACSTKLLVFRVFSFFLCSHFPRIF